MGTVRVKVGTGGAWQNATVTGDSWVINNLTGIVAGLNTIYAQATDAAGNASPENGKFIQVTYDSTGPPPPPAVVCTKTVAKDGSGDFTAIQAAADVAVAGDTVCVKAGTYNERLIPQNSGSAGNWITFKADPNAAHDTVIIDGTGINIPSLQGLVYMNGKSYIKISGFRIQHAKGTALDSGAGVVVRGNPTPWSHVTIENNHIYDTHSSGIDVLGSGSYFIADNNELEMIQNSTVKWSQEGLSVTSETGGVDNIIVSNNHLHHDALWVNGVTYVDNPGLIGCMGGPGINIKDRSTNAKVFGNEVDHIGDCWDWGFGI